MRRLRGKSTRYQPEAPHDFLTPIDRDRPADLPAIRTKPLARLVLYRRVPEGWAPSDPFTLDLALCFISWSGTIAALRDASGSFDSRIDPTCAMTFLEPLPEAIPWEGADYISGWLVYFDRPIWFLGMISRPIGQASPLTPTRYGLELCVRLIECPAVDRGDRPQP